MKAFSNYPLSELIHADLLVILIYFINCNITNTIKADNVSEE